MKLALSALALVLLTGLTSASLAPADEQPSEAVDCQEAEGRAIATDTLVSDGDTLLPVPPPGAGISQSGIDNDGSTSDLSLIRAEDGSLSVSGCGVEGDGSDAGTDDDAKLAPNPCNDDAYDRHGWKWTSTFHWEFNGASTPGEISVGDAEEGLKEGRQAIVNSTNNCDMEDNVSATQSYDGRTDRATQVNSNASCEGFGQRDSHSVAVFGDQPNGRLATTCTYFFIDSGLNTAVESDVKYNKQNYQWARADGGAGCSNLWSVRGVSSHESGHTFGLDHVGEANHGRLTMSPKVNGPCQDSEYTLGRGDVLGLRSIY